MKKHVTKKVAVAVTMASMIMSMTACGGSEPAAPAEPATPDTNPDVQTPAEPEEEPAPYTVLNDPKTGKPYDLGGMEIICRNWWSPEDGSAQHEATTQFEEDVLAYHEWLEKEYNFTFKYCGGLGWGAGITDEFTKYATGGEDDQALLFTLPDGFQGPAFFSGLCWDWQQFDTVDLSDIKYKKNPVTEYSTFGDKTFGVLAGDAEIGNVIYFNRRILEEVGIDPDSIYDKVENGEWTWDAFEDMLKTVQAYDKDGNGEADYKALCANGVGAAITTAALGNGGNIIDKDADGHLSSKIEDAKTVEAAEFAYRIVKDYFMNWHDPAVWDDYRTTYQDGKGAFMIEEGYAGQTWNFVGACEDESGCVPFPTKDGKNFVTTVHGNIIVMPKVYDIEKARLIAFAYDAWETLPVGYEDYNSQAAEFNAYHLDEKGIQTEFDMQKAIKANYAGYAPDLEISSPLDGATWSNVYFANFDGTKTVSEINDSFHDKYEQVLSDWNATLDAME